MPVEKSDTIGLVIDVRGTRHPVVAQRDAIETIEPRVLITVGAKQSTILEAVPQPRAGRIYAVLWLFLVNRKRGTAQRKRERIMEFVDAVREGGAEILEVGSGRSTNDAKQRRSMLSDAFEAVTRGRQPSTTNVRGRRPRKYSDPQKDIMWREWFDVNNVTNDDAAEAASKQLKFTVDQWQIWHVVKDMKIAVGDPNATGASGRPFRKSTKR